MATIFHSLGGEWILSAFVLDGKGVEERGAQVLRTCEFAFLCVWANVTILRYTFCSFDLREAFIDFGKGKGGVYEVVCVQF